MPSYAPTTVVNRKKYVVVSCLRYWLAFSGQAITGLASPFIASVPAKVSQHWFSEGQRPFAIAVLGLSNPVGLVVGQAVTPLMVPSAEDVPIMNMVWFVPALLGTFLTFATVTSSRFHSFHSDCLSCYHVSLLFQTPIPSEPQRRFRARSREPRLPLHPPLPSNQPRLPRPRLRGGRGAGIRQRAADQERADHVLAGILKRFLGGHRGARVRRRDRR